MPKQPPPAPPPEALPAGESNRYLAKLKVSLCKRWSISKTDVLYEIADLATYLWALERNSEAIAIATSVATAIPGPPPLARGGVNYDLWCPATYSHALIVHLGQTILPAQANASQAAILADTGIARDNPSYLAKGVEQARELAVAPSVPKATKWEYQAIARGVARMVLFTELAAGGDPLFAPHAADATALFGQLLIKLGLLLRAA